MVKHVWTLVFDENAVLSLATHHLQSLRIDSKCTKNAPAKIKPKLLLLTSVNDKLQIKDKDERGIKGEKLPEGRDRSQGS